MLEILEMHDASQEELERFVTRSDPAADIVEAIEERMKDNARKMEQARTVSAFVYHKGAAEAYRNAIDIVRGIRG